MEAAEVSKDSSLIERAGKAAVKIAEVTLKEGVEASGGVVAEGGPGGVSNDFKDWWTQAEAAVGFANAFQISGNPVYLEASLKTWDYIEQHIVDPKNGEWFVGIAGDGRAVSPLKISFWKCPYHNGRACMELIHRFRAIQNAHP